MHSKTKKPPVEEIYPAAYILKANIIWLMARDHNTAEELAEVIGVSPKTWRNRMAAPWEFNTGEISELARLWGAAPEQLLTAPVFGEIKGIGETL